MARAIRGSGFAKPKAMRVMSRILVLTDSMSPLDRPCSMAARIWGGVLDDAALERDERFDAAASGPGDPAVEGFGGLVGGEFEDRPQAFLEQVGAVEPGVGLGDPVQLRLLAVGEVLRVLPQRVPGAAQCLGRSGGHGGAPAMGPPVVAGVPGAAGGVPGLATHRIEGSVAQPTT